GRHAGFGGRADGRGDAGGGRRRLPGGAAQCQPEKRGGGDRRPDPRLATARAGAEALRPPALPGQPAGVLVLVTIDYEDTLPGAAHWSLLVRRGRLLRLIDREGG